MQNYTEISIDQQIKSSLALLLNNDKTALSCSSGTAFPTTNLQIGMLCYRTDENKLYLLKDSTPTWVYIADVSLSIASQLAQKLNSSSYTAADVLAKLITVDGGGSGLDADMVDSKHVNGGTVADTIPLRDVNGKLPGDITGNAATVTNGAYTTGDQTIGGTKSFTSTIVGKYNNGGSLANSNDAGSLSVRGDTSNAAAMSFHRVGKYAVNVGLDTDFNFKIGFWSMGTNHVAITPEARIYSTYHGFLDEAFVKTSGDQTIGGTKTFSNQVLFNSMRINAGVWNYSSEDCQRFYFDNGDSSIWRGYGGWFHMFRDGGNVDRVIFEGAGNIYATGNITAYWSDARLKENITPLSGSLGVVNALRGVEFAWNEKGRTLHGKAEGEREIGFIAQEVQEVVPDAVADNVLGTDEEGKPYLTVKPEKLIPHLVEAVKELTAQLAEVRAELAKRVVELERIVKEPKP